MISEAVEKLIGELLQIHDKLSGIYTDYLDKLIIVPGDEEQFEQLAGYQVRLVDLGIANKGMLLTKMKGFRDYNGFMIDSYFEDFEKKIKKIMVDSDYRTSPGILLENRVVGMINAQLTQSDWSSRFDRGTERIYYGLPVCKK